MAFSLGPILLLTFILYVMCAILSFQVVFSRKSILWGLILPTLSFIFALSHTSDLTIISAKKFIATSGFEISENKVNFNELEGTKKDKIAQVTFDIFYRVLNVIGIFAILNIPTVIFLIILIVCRINIFRKKRRMKNQYAI